MSMNGDLRLRFHNFLKQRLHDYLSPRGVERADHRQGKDAVPKLDHGRGQLQQLHLLATDDVFTRCLKRFDGVQPELVQELRRRPQLRGQLRRILAAVRLKRLEQRSLQRKDECRRLIG